MVQQLRESNRRDSFGDGGPGRRATSSAQSPLRSRASCLPPGLPATVRVPLGAGPRPPRWPGRPARRRPQAASAGAPDLRGVPS